jgi:hypothetical protein
MLFDENRADTEPRQLERGRHPDRACADDDHLCLRLVPHVKALPSW